MMSTRGLDDRSHLSDQGGHMGLFPIGEPNCSDSSVSASEKVIHQLVCTAVLQPDQ